MDSTLSPNKQTVKTYMRALNDSDHPRILPCLTDDIERIMPGAYHLKGKAAFDKEIENDVFVMRDSKVAQLTSYLVEYNE